MAICTVDVVIVQTDGPSAEVRSFSVTESCQDYGLINMVDGLWTWLSTSLSLTADDFLAKGALYEHICLGC